MERERRGFSAEDRRSRNEAERPKPRTRNEVQTLSLPTYIHVYLFFVFVLFLESGSVLSVGKVDGENVVLSQEEGDE